MADVPSLLMNAHFQLWVSDYLLRNHLMISPSPLNCVSQDFVKVFQYWCQYQVGVFFVTLLPPFQGSMQYSESCTMPGLITLMQFTRYFKVYSNYMKPFKDQIFQLLLSTNAKTCVIEIGPEFQCINLFVCSRANAILTKKKSHVYNENDIPQEDFYLKK